jgi:hypothetical protein
MNWFIIVGSLWMAILKAMVVLGVGFLQTSLLISGFSSWKASSS